LHTVADANVFHGAAPALFHPTDEKEVMFLLTKDRALNDALVSREIDRLLRLATDLKAIRDGSGPTANDLGDAPILNKWTPEVRPAPCLVGSVTDHPRLPGIGRPIITSDLWVLAEDQGWARTLSRWYRLGRRQPAT
jgi:hypothetical protein